jgi:WD40 repeat protein
VYSAVFNPDGSRILTASRDGTARLWDINGSLLNILSEHSHEVLFAAFNRDGSRIVTTSFDRTARLWDANGTPLGVMGGHKAQIGSADISGNQIVTASDDETAILWEDPFTVLEGHQAWLQAIVFNSDGSRTETFLLRPATTIRHGYGTLRAVSCWLN